MMYISTSVETLEDVGTTTPMLHYNATRVTATLHTHIARRQDTPDDMPVGATLSHKVTRICV